MWIAHCNIRLHTKISHPEPVATFQFLPLINSNFGHKDLIIRISVG